MVIRTNEAIEVAAGVERGGEMQERCWYGGSFSFRVICGSLVVRIDAASRPITIHRTTITPLGYIPAHRILLFPSCPLISSRPLPRTHACPPTRAPFSLSLRPSSSLLALLQIARHTYPASLEKNCSGFELLPRYSSLTLSLSLSFSRGSNYYSLFLRPRFKLS